MKSFSIIALLIFSTNIIASAQSNKTINADSLIVKNAAYESIIKEVYSYTSTPDHEKRKLKTDGYVRSANNWIKNYIVSYTYDGESNLISEEFNVLADISNYEYLLPHKNIFTYNVEKDILTEEYFIKEPSQSANWKGKEKRQYIYLGEKPTEVLVFRWKSETSAWVDSLKYNYTYDSNGYQTLAEVYENINGQWKPQTKEEKAYTPSGNVLTETYYTGKEISNDWIKQSRTEYAYTSNTLQQSIYYISDNGIVWTEQKKSTYTYPTSDIIDIIHSLKDNSQNNWIITSRDTKTYENGKLVSNYSELWDNKNGLWQAYILNNYVNTPIYSSSEAFSYTPDGTKIGLSRQQKTKNDLGLTTSESNYLWNSNSESWSLKNEITYEYDDNSNLINIEKFDGKNSEIIPYIKTSTTYDTSDNLTNHYTYKWINDNWSIIQYKMYYYDDKTTISEDSTLQQKPLIWWSNDNIYIQIVSDIQNVSVYAINGKQLYNGKNPVISTKEWQRGVYIVKVKGEDGEMKSSKILIKTVG